MEKKKTWYRGTEEHTILGVVDSFPLISRVTTNNPLFIRVVAKQISCSGKTCGDPKAISAG